jgi:hypothetical protein
VRFYLGTHRPHWLNDSTAALFVSQKQLADRCKRTLPRASCDWALDSGGFTELLTIDRHTLTWSLSPQRYAARTRRYHDQIGRLDWAAPQDWMCEPFMLERTGLTVAEHQARTIRSVLDLRTLWPDGPFVPVLQGWTVDDYLRHVDAYTAAGFDLEAEPVVGLGSVCRRQATGEGETIVMRLQPIRLHGFGMKTEAVARYGSLLASCDSLAWSYAGRRRPDPACPKRSCANCRHYAMAWRERLLNPTTPTLFGEYAKATT